MGAEFEFISRIQDMAPSAGSDAVVIGIGDDCAVLAPTHGWDQLISTDMLIEGVHFDPDTISLVDLGHKALAVNLSDLAAMGGVARTATLSLGLPGVPHEYLPLVQGFLDLAAVHGVRLVGGDTCASPTGILISVGVGGEVPGGTAITRAGACPGDQLFVTGSMGDSAAGLSILSGAQPGGDDDATKLVARHTRPTPRLSTGARLRELSTHAMIDISDGLLADLGHIAQASAVGIQVNAEAVPVSVPLSGMCKKWGVSPLKFALGGGEDYELAFAIPANQATSVAELADAEGLSVTCIGQVVEGAGVTLLKDGKQVTPPVPGYEHFS